MQGQNFNFNCNSPETQEWVSLVQHGITLGTVVRTFLEELENTGFANWRQKRIKPIKTEVIIAELGACLTSPLHILIQ